MPQPAHTQTYAHLLEALIKGAMTILGRVGAEAKSTPDTAATLDIHQAVRHYAVLGIIVRRAIVVSDDLARRPVPAEQHQGRIPQALDRVFAIFAANKMEAAAYHAAMDAEIDGPDDDDFDDPDSDEFDSEPVENADVPGRPAAALAAELCRDLGMAMHAVPAEWLDPISADLRLLCARAAAAAIKPTPAPRETKGVEGSPLQDQNPIRSGVDLTAPVQPPEPSATKPTS